MLALIALTMGLYDFVPRYRPADRQLLQNHDFGRNLAEWSTAGRVRHDPNRLGTVALEVAGGAVGRSVLRQTVDLVQLPATVILRAEIAAEIVAPDDGRLGGAWIIIGELAGSDPGSLYWRKGAFQPYRATASHGWGPLQAILTIPTDSRTLTFEAGVGGGAGSVLRIANLGMLEAAERTAFRVGRLALMLAWGLTAVWGSATIYRSLDSGSARLAFALLLGVGALGLLMPGVASPHASPLWAWASAAEAAGHATLFVFLALTFRLGRPLDPFWLCFVVLALVAGASEVVQCFVPGRGPELYDWLIDLAGIVAGLALFDPALRLYGRVVGRNRVR